MKNVKIFMKHGIEFNVIMEEKEADRLKQKVKASGSPDTYSYITNKGTLDIIPYFVYAIIIEDE